MGSHAGKEDETCAKAHDFQEISMFIDEKQLEKHMCRKCLHLIVSISEGFHDLSSFSTSTKSENIRKDKIEIENDPGARTHSYVLQCQRLEKREQLFVDFLHVHKKSPRGNAESDLQKKRNASVEFGGKERTLIPLKKFFFRREGANTLVRGVKMRDL